MGDAWDDDAFAVRPLSDDEEAYVPSSKPEWGEEADAPDAGDDVDELPTLLVDLTALARDLGQEGRDVAAVRAKVLETLASDFSDRASSLLHAGVCWHVPRGRSAEERRAHEEAQPGVVLTTIDYPSVLEGVRTEVLWEAVARPTAWEVVDAFKLEVSRTARSLKYQADLCVEIEELAEREAQAAEALTEAEAELEEARSERTRVIGAMQMRHGDDGELPAEQARVMLDAIDTMDARVERAAAAHAEVQQQREEEQQAAEAASGGRPSLLDVLLNLVFERHPPPHVGSSWAQHATEVAEARRRLRRMWISTFGRLPAAASSLALKHAPPAPPDLPPPPPRPLPGQAQRPRMLVPPPPPRTRG